MPKRSRWTDFLDRPNDTSSSGSGGVHDFHELLAYANSHPINYRTRINAPSLDHDRIDRHLLIESIAGIDSLKMHDTTSLADKIIHLIVDSGPTLEADLADLLGYDCLDFLGSLIAHREELALLDDRLISSERKELSIFSSERPNPVTSRQPASVYRPTSQVTVTTALSKQHLKELRKNAAKLAKSSQIADAQNSESFDVKNCRQAREEALTLERPLVAMPTNSTGSQIQYPHVYSRTVDIAPSSKVRGGNSLPVGSVRIDNAEFEEITIPITKTFGQLPGERCVPISEMEPWMHSAFAGYTELNRIQSIVYPAAMMTNENLLICAPTGAGKTDIAMLTVLSAISQYRQTDSNHKEYKMIYVAPMKALAAEVARKFSARLASLGVQVRELTGDTSLTRHELEQTQMLVVTPEKYDVITRKSGQSENDLASQIRLLIIDEVHLLHDDRGAVLESIVARTLRLVESTQSVIRIVGLSATLPNYVDVAEFLRVNPQKGMFFFDDGFRPVPLGQSFVGIKGSRAVFKERLDRVAYEKVAEMLEQSRQAMVFVHSRKDTVKSGKSLRQLAVHNNTLTIFEVSAELKVTTTYLQFEREFAKSKNQEMKQLFQYGIGCHHAGMLRSDRTLTERAFEKGILRVLVCTATLAWGVNLPAYAVIIKGTQVYDSVKGGFVDLSVLDVTQVFGRAGRPQYEPHGLGYILTTHDKLAHYLTRMCSKTPIESQFGAHLVDNLNAEISATGTVSNLDEAVQWLSYTYFHVRLRRNPLAYGLNAMDLALDPQLVQHRRELLLLAIKALVKNQMIAFDENSGFLVPTDLGRTAAAFYVRSDSIEIFNSGLHAACTEADILGVISCSHEFDGIKIRDEEVASLISLVSEGYTVCQVKNGVENTNGKINVLMQAYISRAPLTDFGLISDCGYIAQNAPRIVRALLEICIKRRWGPAASSALALCRAFERKLWSFEHPLAQFNSGSFSRHTDARSPLTTEVLKKLNSLDLHLSSIENLREMSIADIGTLVRNQRFGGVIHGLVKSFPLLQLNVRCLPLTRTVLKVEVVVNANFFWNDKYSGGSESWWIMIEDDKANELLAFELFTLTKQKSLFPHKLFFIIPIGETVPSSMCVKASSDRWVGADTWVSMPTRNIVLPEAASPHTDLLDIHPLPLSALKDSVLESMYSTKFQHFNPIQTQVFHSLYHTDQNILLGAPTSSGKTVCAELALFRAFRTKPKSICVYIAPLKALVRERVADWKEKLFTYLGKRVTELTGDSAPDIQTILSSDVIITSTFKTWSLLTSAAPEKWDGMSRLWKQREYIQRVSLVIIDEIHLLGVDRGPILEVIVSRLNYISFHTGSPIRVVGLSTALANAQDLGRWLNIHPSSGLFNFRHSVRPVPLEIFIDGFSERHYCPRMATMNKPVFRSILTHSPDQPVIVFVSSRRQTRLTANDLISLCALNCENPKRFLKMEEDAIEMLCTGVKDPALVHSLTFGIGLHHAGLAHSDRELVEELFLAQKIQILIATSTLAWGVNIPAHLCIVKGTEYFDAKQNKYVDFPITDVLQMIGRCGRPQFDTSGKAHVMVLDSKKSFYKKFLHEPFPVESSLHEHLLEHLNAEVVSGIIKSVDDARDYLTWTYFHQRLKLNPTYYGVTSTESHNDHTDFDAEYAQVSLSDVSRYVENLIRRSTTELETCGCVVLTDPELLSENDDEENEIMPTILGVIASQYYMSSYTMKLFDSAVNGRSSLVDLIRVVSSATEYSEHPVRHNEDLLNRQLAEIIKEKVTTLEIPSDLSTPQAKVELLLQAVLTRIDLRPISADYVTDTTTILDQVVRIMQALIDVCADHHRSLLATVHSIQLLQCIKSASWWDESAVYANDIVKSNWMMASVAKEYDNLESLRSSARGPNGKTELRKIFKRLTGMLEYTQRDLDKCWRILLSLPQPFMDADFKTKDGNVPVVKRNRVLLERNRHDHTCFEMHIYLQDESKDSSVYARLPHFSKQQRGGWFVVVGDTESDQVIFMKRISITTGSKSHCIVPLDFTDLSSKKLSVHLLNDSFRGIDLSFEIPAQQ